MKKQILFYGILFSILIINSCSKNDDSNDNDIIIGKWRPIERYESNQQVEMPTCLPYIYTEFKTDKSINSYMVSTLSIPNECGNINFELGWNWKNLGNNEYRIRQFEYQDYIFTFYKDGVNLVEEHPDGITKTVHEPYNN